MNIEISAETGREMWGVVKHAKFASMNLSGSNVAHQSRMGRDMADMAVPLTSGQPDATPTRVAQDGIRTSALGGAEKLLDQMSNSEKYFNERRKPLRRLDQILFLIQAILILLTTMLTGLKITGAESLFNNLALAASALASFFTVIMGRFAFRDRWVAYTDASSQLSALKSRLELQMVLASAGQRPWLSADEILIIHQEMQAVHDRVDARWRQSVTAVAPAKGHSG